MSRTSAAQRLAGIASLVLAPLSLASCGDSGAATPPPTAVVAERLVFISVKDCAESNKIERAACEAIIDEAIARHVANAASFTSTKSCETAESADHCERTAAKAYRPRLLAFLVTASTPPTAVPLYAANGGDPGFHTLEGKPILVSDETLTFSKLASAALEQ